MKICVAIPVYNGTRKMLETCFDSILNQAEDIFQLVVTNDGSDNQETVKVLEEYTEKYPKKFKLVHIVHGGISAARNAGLDAASGDYIQFASQDHAFEQGYFRQMAEHINKNKPDIAPSQVVKINYDTNEILKILPEDKYKNLYWTNEPEWMYYNLSFLNKNNLRFTGRSFFEALDIGMKAFCLTDKICFFENTGHIVYERVNSTSSDRRKFNNNVYNDFPSEKYIETFEQIYKLNTPPPRIRAEAEDEKKRSVLLFSFMHSAAMLSSLFISYSKKEEQKKFIDFTANTVRKITFKDYRPVKYWNTLFCSSAQKIMVLIYHVMIKIRSEHLFAFICILLIKCKYQFSGIVK